MKNTDNEFRQNGIDALLNFSNYRSAKPSEIRIGSVAAA